MKRGVSSFSIILIFICLGIVGGALIPFLSIQLNPSRSSTNLHISYLWREASAKVIEHEVTSKLEGVINEMKEIKSINSFSENGRGSIRIDFKEGVNMDATRFEVANKIRQIYFQLPSGVTYPSISASTPSTKNETLLTYSVNADKSPYYIDKYIRKYILPKLSNLEGVSSVDLYGATPYEWVVSFHPDHLLQLQLSADDLVNAIHSYIEKMEIGMGKVIKSTGELQIPLFLVQKDSFELEWGEIPVKRVGDRILYLRDLARVQFKEKPVNSYHRVNGLNTVSLIFFAESGANTIKSAAIIKNKMEDIRQELPKEYQVKKTSDESDYLIDELRKIKNRTFISLSILLLLTLLIYRNLKYTCILFFGIFLNLLIAAIFYYFFQIELQLYSFAGITVSFGIIIDNTIVMMDHMRNKGDKKAFLAILASTITTIAAVVIIFFLEESQRNDLLDFAYVIIINLMVSLLVALYLVPALIEKIQFHSPRNRLTMSRKRRTLKLLCWYSDTLKSLRKPKFKWGLISIFILGFGIPIHILPDKIENSGNIWAIHYNETLGNEKFKTEYRPLLEKILGGSFRLFTQEIFSTSYQGNNGQTKLTISGSAPKGGNIEQLNASVIKIENYLSSFEEIERFETNVAQGNSSTIIYFKKKYELSNFPFLLKNLVQTKAISLGGMDWSVRGIGRGFSNILDDNAGNIGITLEGYSYDNLYHFAERLKRKIIEQSGGRVKKVDITSNGNANSVREELNLIFDPELLALNNITISQLYEALQTYIHSGFVGRIVNNEEMQEIILSSEEIARFNKWDLENKPIVINSKQFKLKQLATVVKMSSGNDIMKNNQQYHLELKYDFLGPYQLSNKFKEELIKEYQETLPMGYKVFSKNNSFWNMGDTKQYYYIVIIIIAIFFICSILLESLVQPFAIISMIPISFIGAFLTFYLLDINFDQGGYASFILLSGLSVNAALFIINEYNNLALEQPERAKYTLYLKAFANKIVPILITILTTTFGLLPFVITSEKEFFWYSFAVGSIGGLLFSVIGLLIYLPIFSLSGKRIS